MQGRARESIDPGSKEEKPGVVESCDESFTGAPSPPFLFPCHVPSSPSLGAFHGGAACLRQASFSHASSSFQGERRPLTLFGKTVEFRHQSACQQFSPTPKDMLIPMLNLDAIAATHSPRPACARPSSARRPHSAAVARPASARASRGASTARASGGGDYVRQSHVYNKFTQSDILIKLAQPRSGDHAAPLPAPYAELASSIASLQPLRYPTPRPSTAPEHRREQTSAWALAGTMTSVMSAVGDADEWETASPSDGVSPWRRRSLAMAEPEATQAEAAEAVQSGGDSDRWESGVDWNEFAKTHPDIWDTGAATPPLMVMASYDAKGGGGKWGAVLAGLERQADLEDGAWVVTVEALEPVRCTHITTHIAAHISHVHIDHRGGVRPRLPRECRGLLVLHMSQARSVVSANLTSPPNSMQTAMYAPASQ